VATFIIFYFLCKIGGVWQRVVDNQHAGTVFGEEFDRFWKTFPGLLWECPPLRQPAEFRHESRHW